MQTKTTRILIASLHLAVMGACTSTPTSSAPKTPGEEVKEGWQDVKEGSKGIATGVGDAAKETGETIVDKSKEAGRDIKAGAQEAGQAVKAATCPVVGNRTTRRYYTERDKDYTAMLKGDKFLQADQRECFMSEKAALSDGYKKAL